MRKMEDPMEENKKIVPKTTAKKPVSKQHFKGFTRKPQKNIVQMTNIQDLELSMLSGDLVENISSKKPNNTKPATTEVVVKTLQRVNTNKKPVHVVTNNIKVVTNNIKKVKQDPQDQTKPVQNKAPKKQNNKKEPSLNIIPLGGLGEVGKNITVFECQGDMFILDCGLVFPDSEMLGVDLVIPDFTFIIENQDKIKGIVITHGHEDHIGALPFLLKQVNFPIYATRLALGLIKNKLKEHNLLATAQLNEIKGKKRFKLGCFKLDPIPVNHSIPDAVGYAIDSPAGVVIHTGDFKIDYTPTSGKPVDLSHFSEYGQKGVLALLSDSTNAERPGSSMSEKKVAESFEKLFNTAENKRIIIATFASNIQRVQEILSLAEKHGRKVAVSGRSMVNNTEMALELGYLKFNKGSLIDIDAVNKYPPEKVVIVTTGSQGEPLSALTRMSNATHRNVKLGKGDFIIVSANPIPGNEKTVGRVVNSLLKLGAEVIYESMYDIHTSGHAYNDEQKIIMNLTKPKFFIPVHGEYKHLKKHAELALSMGIPEKNIHIGETGEVITLTKDKIAVTNTVVSGQVFVDGLGVGDVGSVVIRDRKVLSQEGLVIVVATIDSATGELISGPDIVSRGFVYVREREDLIEEARRQVQGVFDVASEENLRDLTSLKAKIRDRVSQLMWRKTKRNPMILPIIMEV